MYSFFGTADKSELSHFMTNDKNSERYKKSILSGFNGIFLSMQISIRKLGGFNDHDKKKKSAQKRKNKPSLLEGFVRHF